MSTTIKNLVILNYSLSLHKYSTLRNDYSQTKTIKMKTSKKSLSFNINKTVRVKLNKDGYEQLAKNHNEYLGIIPNWEENWSDYYEKQADKYGYTSFQLWEFIEKFGDTIRLSSKLCFDTEIIFNYEDFTECDFSTK